LVGSSSAITAPCALGSRVAVSFEFFLGEIDLQLNPSRMRAAINPNLFEIINKNKAFRVRTGKALKMVEF
jgi:hypothetical protein